MKTRRRPAPLAIALIGAVACLATRALASPPSYRVEPIGASATGLSGFDMNESLTVVGRSLSAQQIGRAFVAHRGEEPTLLPVPPQWQSSDAA